jgi:hypothetical protein
LLLSFQKDLNRAKNIFVVIHWKFCISIYNYIQIYGAISESLKTPEQHNGIKLIV